MFTENYNRLDRAVHGIVLGSRTVQRLSFDIENQGFTESGSKNGHEGAVFVCGLARSGTTALLRLLYETGEFESLTYRDMPFVLMPRLWARVTQPLSKTSVAAERAHGDSVMVDFDSPEGFESVFWRTFCGKQYNAGNYLAAHDPDEETLVKFRMYVATIASRTPGERRRYLSKNNNNILRIGAIQRALPDAGIITLYRDPLQTAASSIRQHARFCEAQKQDRFVLKYMNWLEHHEFGLGHKPFRFTSGAPVSNPSEHDYWLRYWIEVYTHVLSEAGPVHLVNYESFCRMPNPALSRLFKCLNMKSDPAVAASKLKIVPQNSVPAFDAELVDEAQAIHGRLCADRRNVFCVN